MNEAPIVERLRALALFVPVFEAEDFTFGEWNSPPGQMPWFNLSAEARRFVSAASQYDWVVPEFDWPSWQQTDEAQRLLSDPQSIECANVVDLERLLTVHIRLERFSEGHLAAAFEGGFLLAIARRSATLLHEIEVSE